MKGATEIYYQSFFSQILRRQGRRAHALAFPLFKRVSSHREKILTLIACLWLALLLLLTLYLFLVQLAEYGWH